MKIILLALLLSASTIASAQSVGGNGHGTRGGNGPGGAPGSTSNGYGHGEQAGHPSASIGQAAQGGQGGNYWAPSLNSSLVDAFQPWPESEMRQFQQR
jgi:hypothetical protein